MPSLDWIGKKAVVNHHKQVPLHLLRCNGDLSVGDPERGNLLVQRGPDPRTLGQAWTDSDGHGLTNWNGLASEMLPSPVKVAHKKLVFFPELIAVLPVLRLFVYLTYYIVLPSAPQFRFLSILGDKNGYTEWYGRRIGAG